MLKIKLEAVQKRWLKALQNAGFTKKQSEELVDIMSEMIMTRSDVLDFLKTERSENREFIERERTETRTRLDRVADGQSTLKNEFSTLSNKFTGLETKIDTRAEMKALTKKNILFTVSIMLGVIALIKFIQYLYPLLG